MAGPLKRARLGDPLSTVTRPATRAAIACAAGYAPQVLVDRHDLIVVRHSGISNRPRRETVRFPGQESAW